MSGVSVYDLGLIYNIDIDEKEGIVELTHTLTSAFCPYADEIVHAIHKACEVDNVESVNIITTFKETDTEKLERLGSNIGISIKFNYIPQLVEGVNNLDVYVENINSLSQASDIYKFICFIRLINIQFLLYN